MKTVATDKLPEITWERGDYVESHDHVAVYIALGTSEDGREWSAAWNVTDGHFESIEGDIECEYTPYADEDAEPNYNYYPTLAELQAEAKKLK
jgi:hypothetical protein